MKRVFWAFLLSTLLLLGGCESDIELEFIAKNQSILAFGDSLTFGKGVQKTNAYPSVLAHLSARRVINAGISGEVSADGLRRMAGVLDKYQPKLMILLEGGNDILRSLNLKNTQKNLSKMITLAKSKGVQVLLIGVPKRSIFLSSAGFYQTLANTHQLLFMPDLLPDLLSEKKYKSDLIHLNKLGYQIMAQKIYEKLKTAGAL
jgi:lysophospholipase L1-like esterase